MAKLPKKNKPTAANGTIENATTDGSKEMPANSEAAPLPNETPASAKVMPKRARTPARKTSAPSKPRTATRRKPQQPAEVAVSEDEIRLRAYFLGENRLRAGIPGDVSSDWHEARRQLLAEAASRP